MNLVDRMKKNKLTDRDDVADRNREVLLICLDRFVSHGLTDTSLRDLSRSIKLQVSVIYWYLKIRRKRFSYVRKRPQKSL